MEGGGGLVSFGKGGLVVFFAEIELGPEGGGAGVQAIPIGVTGGAVRLSEEVGWLSWSRGREWVVGLGWLSGNSTG